MNIKKKRILFFAYEGIGLGHLMRLVKVAERFRNDYIPMVVSSHQAIGEIVPDGVEYMRLPNFASQYYENGNFNEKILKVKVFRNYILNYVFKCFKPDVVVTDFLASGKKNELSDALINYPSLKYLVLRGNIGSRELIENVVFSTENCELLKNQYQRIFVASDSSVSDFLHTHSLPPLIAQKVLVAGFVTKLQTPEAVAKARSDRGIAPGERWIVCSAGGGRLGESLVERCLAIAKDSRFSQYKFDIVQGYYSDIAYPSDLYNTIPINNNTLYSKGIRNLPLLHASADMVICCGGYNTLLESMQGRSKQVLAYSVQRDCSEQADNINCLAQNYSIHKIESLDNLDSLILSHIEEAPHPVTPYLNMGGIETIFQIISQDIKNYATGL